MNKKFAEGYKYHYNDEILQSLVDDPTKSVREISDDLGSYRQKIWRRKNKLENEHIIWGYTSIVDESKMNHVMYLVLLKLKPMSKKLVELLIKRSVERIPEKQKIRSINVLYINGEYDLMIMFTSSNHANARRYFDSLRIAYGRYILEKPLIVDVNFSLVREGKVNPEIERLHEFVPE